MSQEPKARLAADLLMVALFVWLLYALVKSL